MTLTCADRSPLWWTCQVGDVSLLAAVLARSSRDRGAHVHHPTYRLDTIGAPATDWQRWQCLGPGPAKPRRHWRPTVCETGIHVGEPLAACLLRCSHLPACRVRRHSEVWGLLVHPFRCGPAGHH